MAFTFNPEIVEKIFTALRYFRTWIVLFLFPVCILSIDFAYIYFKRIYYPSPTDVIAYNEQDIISSSKQIKMNELNEIVDPFSNNFKDNDYKVKSKRYSDRNYVNPDKDATGNGNGKTDTISEHLRKRSDDANSKSELTNQKKSMLLKNKEKQNGEDRVNTENSKGSKSYIKESKPSEEVINLNDNMKKRNLSLANKKDSVFANVDFDIMEGKKLISNIIILLT